MARALGLGLAVLALFACGPKVIREPVYHSDRVQVSLRRVLEDGAPRPKGHAHPVTVSDVRLAHVMASITHKNSKDEPKPTVRSEYVYELAEGMRDALGRAAPDDEVLVTLQIGDRRFGLFNEDKVTAFRVWCDDASMRIEFFEIESAVERESGRAQPETYEFPLEPPTASPRFRMVAGYAQTLDGPRALQVDWRDAYYGKPVNLSVRGGRVQRRTLLLEAEPESQAPEPAPASEALPPATRDAQMRALDQLDAARRSGLLTESEFQRRRRLVLDGRLGEAGYPAP